MPSESIIIGGSKKNKGGGRSRIRQRVQQHEGLAGAGGDESGGRGEGAVASKREGEGKG